MSLNGSGPHLMLDIYGCGSGAASFEKVHQFLNQLPALINMSKLAPPYVIKQDKPHDKGITGVVILETSHASIHTWPEHGFAAIDVYSCKDFDPDVVIAFAKKLFSPQDMKVNFVQRGSGVPIEA